MKVLDRLLITRFAGPLVVTFFITLFVLVMQFLWKYVDDLVGKGLGYDVLAEFLFYSSATLVPLALPLAILLASIMTFGNLGEHFELTAIKSSGISLFRFMRMLIVFVVLLSALAFYFSNNILPLANLKLTTLLHGIKQQKPALSFDEGIFNDEIEGFSMRVGRKGGDGQHVYDITIYDHSEGLGNNHVIRADSGRMFHDSTGRVLTIRLFDGQRYKEVEPYPRENSPQPHTRTAFAQMEKKFDLSGFSFQESDEEMFSDLQRMLNLPDLIDQADTMRSEIERYHRTGTHTLGSQLPVLLPPGDTVVRPFLDSVAPRDLQADIDSLNRVDLLQAHTIARIKARNVLNTASNTFKVVAHKRSRLVRTMVEIHRKFTLSVACLVLFFIGAPLGAIIRKGGFGWPLVLATIFFVAYHVSSIIGEKMAEEMTVEPHVGMWLSTMILFPIGVFLTIKAGNDAPLLNGERYRRLFDRLRPSSND